MLSLTARFSKAFWTFFAFTALSVSQSQAQPPPPNDNLAHAQPIIGITGTVAGSNISATAELGEPAPAGGFPAQSTIWYVWTAPITTTIDFNTRGSTDPYGYELDTVLAVYRLALAQTSPLPT